MDWDKIWDDLDNEENWAAEKYRAQSTLLAVQDFRKHWNRYVPSGYFIRLPSLTAPSFNQDVLRRRYAQSSKDALERAGVNDIKLYLMHRAQGSPKHRRGKGLRQSTVFGFYKTLQMAYFIDTGRQLQKRTNEMVNNVGAHTNWDNLNTLTRSSLSKPNLPRNSTLQKGSKTKQLALSGFSTTFCTTIGARMLQAPPMGDIGFRRPF